MAFDDDEHVSHEVLAQDDILPLPIRVNRHTPNAPPLFLDMRPLRKESDLIARVPHLSSFIAESTYTYLDETLFARNNPVFIGGSPRAESPVAEASPAESAPSLLTPPSPIVDISQIRAARQLAEEQASIAERSEARRRKALDWSSVDTHSLLLAPFYLYQLPSEFAYRAEQNSPITEPFHDPHFRALPILSPNLPEAELAEARFLNLPGHQTQDPDSPILSAPSSSPAHRRVFVALYLAPTSARKKFAGWRIASKFKAARFRFDLKTEEQIEEDRNMRAQRREDRLHSLSTTEAQVFSDSRAERAKTRVKREAKISKTDSEPARLLCSAEPDADPEDPINEFEIGVTAMDWFRRLLFEPRPLFYWQEEWNQKKVTPLLNPQYVETTDSGEMFALENGFFGVAELPERFSEFFASFDVTQPVRNLNAQQRRRLTQHTRRPRRPNDTHLLIAPSGQARICPSLRHMSMILPPGMTPTDAHLRMKRVKSFNSQVVVRVWVEPDPSRMLGAPKIIGGRASVGTTLPPHFLELLNVTKEGHDPEHPYYTLLEEPPLLTLPDDDPSGPGVPTLTLVFRTFLHDDGSTHPMHTPIPDADYTLFEEA